jgi:hypothetical protein
MDRYRPENHRQANSHIQTEDRRKTQGYKGINTKINRALITQDANRFGPVRSGRDERICGAGIQKAHKAYARLTKGV